MRTFNSYSHYSWSLLFFLCLISLISYGQHRETGKMVWPENNALPYFAQPDTVIDLLDMGELSLSPLEKLAVTALQGLVNSTKPRIYLMDKKREEGKDWWSATLNLQTRKITSPLKLIDKYKDEVSGVILFSSKQNVHFINLATTIGGIKNALPITDSLNDVLKSNGIVLPVLADLRNLQLNTPLEVYRYLYDHYWQQCNKRLYVSLAPGFSNYIRDVAVATKSAVIWLDPRKKEDSLLANRFLNDMPQGRSCILGWWPEERSGVGLGTKHGIPTIAADFFENATVFAGQSHTIHLPAVPKMPELKNKIYLAIYMSDGDNIQYCQHSLVKLWQDKKRGTIPINWTISPALYDIAPQMLNYYYQTATVNDCFASGPSGLGYALIYDALGKKLNMPDNTLLDTYTRFSAKYLEQCGLRIITIWDEVSPAQMKIYADNCPYLYGNTREDWGRGAALKPCIIDERMPFVPNRPGYAGNIEQIFHSWSDTIKKFDGKQPLFLSAQGVSWKMTPENIQALEEQLQALSPGNITVCRGDHFFNLYLQANHGYFNLCMLPDMLITSDSPAADISSIADGSRSTTSRWTGEQWIRFDFRKNYLISRLALLYPREPNGKMIDGRSLQVEVSQDNRKWTTAAIRVNPATLSINISIPAVKARYVRIRVNKGMKETLGDIEIYGKEL